MFAAIVASGSGDGSNAALEIALPSVLVPLLVIAVVVTVVCIAFYCHRRVTSLNYVLSKSGLGSNSHGEDEKTSLMSHEYDTVCTEDFSKSHATSTRERSSSPQAIESEYSVIRADHVTRSSKRDSRSRSLTPDTTLTAGAGSGATSYGAVDQEKLADENPYSYVRVDRKRSGPRSRSMHTDPSEAHASEYTPRARATTSVHQSLKHSQSGTYVPSRKERAQLIEAHYETDPDISVYDRLEFFETSKEFWRPAQTAPDLYAQFSDNKYREIPRRNIIILEEIGSGQCGTVCKGLWTCDGDSMHVAVKSLQESASERERVKFLQEAALMGQFSHPNIIGICGVVTITAPTVIVLELATTDLHKYLRGIRLSRQYTDYLPRQLLQFSSEIAAGMDYLSKKGFVHRDLAARNILLDHYLVCKIGDFGMARDLMDEEFYTSTENRPLPVKWMAPEALLYRTFSTASDVWSYGMVLYEIWSVGQKPYHDLTNKDVIDNLQERHCHPPPPGCPRAVYTLMVGCWHPEAKRRLSFRHLYQSLRQPEEYLLSWTDDDTSVSALASQLGADHSHSLYLYTDLQRKYLTDTDTQ